MLTRSERRVKPASVVFELAVSKNDQIPAGRQRTEAGIPEADADVGGDIVSAGGTGMFDLHAGTGVTEVRAGSYALMDTHDGQQGLPFEQALFVLGTAISVQQDWAVSDVGLNRSVWITATPSVRGGAVRFCSDEHVTFQSSVVLNVGDTVTVIPAHVDPTVSMHEAAWLVRGDEAIDRSAIDLRHW